MRYIIATFILPQSIKLMKKQSIYLFKNQPNSTPLSIPEFTIQTSVLYGFRNMM